MFGHNYAVHHYILYKQSFYLNSVHSGYIDLSICTYSVGLFTIMCQHTYVRT